MDTESKPLDSRLLFKGAQGVRKRLSRGSSGREVEGWQGPRQAKQWGPAGKGGMEKAKNWQALAYPKTPSSWLCGMSEDAGRWAWEPDGASLRVCAAPGKHAKDPRGMHSTPGCWVRSGIPVLKHFWNLDPIRRSLEFCSDRFEVSTGMSVFYYNYHKLEIHKITEIQGHQWNSM